MSGVVLSRYWRVHFTADPYDHYVNIDCGRGVSESVAVQLAERAYPHRGYVTTAIEDYGHRYAAAAS